MRLDRALVARGLARSRTHAQSMIASGRVAVTGRATVRASLEVSDADEILIEPDPYVSRAAHKLLGALDDSLTPVPPRVLDAGASTGGFTQVLLERGAARVYAVDVGHDQLAAQVRRDPRVVVHERTNLRDLTLAHVEGHPVDLVVADVSFISLTLLLRPLLDVLDPDGTALLMVKPQFEVGRGHLGPHGVVTDPAERERAVSGVLAAAGILGWTCEWTGLSRLPGPAGNVEVFVRLRRRWGVRADS